MPPKGERRKYQIINTAKDMFMEKGFQSTHIGQVCEKLNIARGTVYQYFSNKKEILYAILYSVIEKIEDIFDNDDLQEFFRSNPDSVSMIQFISKRVSESIAVMVNEPIVIKLVFKEIVGIDSDVVVKVNESMLKIAKIIGREVKEIKTRGIFKASLDPEITASMIIGGVMMLVYEYEKKNLDILDKTVIESITDNYLRGILVP